MIDVNIKVLMKSRQVILTSRHQALLTNIPKCAIRPAGESSHQSWNSLTQPRVQDIFRSINTSLIYVLQTSNIMQLIWLATWSGNWKNYPACKKTHRVWQHFECQRHESLHLHLVHLYSYCWANQKLNEHWGWSSNQDLQPWHELYVSSQPRAVRRKMSISAWFTDMGMG